MLLFIRKNFSHHVNIFAYFSIDFLWDQRFEDNISNDSISLYQTIIGSFEKKFDGTNQLASSPDRQTIKARDPGRILDRSQETISTTIRVFLSSSVRSISTAKSIITRSPKQILNHENEIENEKRWRTHSAHWRKVFPSYKSRHGHLLLFYKHLFFIKYFFLRWPNSKRHSKNICHLKDEKSEEEFVEISERTPSLQIQERHMTFRLNQVSILQYRWFHHFGYSIRVLNQHLIERIISEYHLARWIFPCRVDKKYITRKSA